MAVTTPTFESNDLNDSGTWTAFGSPAVADDLHGTDTTADFDGVDDLYDTGNEYLTSGTSATISFWAKTSGAAVYAPINERDIDATGAGFQIRIGVGTVQASFNSSSSNYIRSTTSDTFNDGEWHHFLAVCNAGSSVDIYVDGEVPAFSSKDSVGGTGFAGFVSNTKTLQVGDNQLGTLPFLGGVARPRVWNSALPVAEILEEYSNEAAAMTVDYPELGLIRYYDHNDNAANTTVDDKGSDASDGTLTNAGNTADNTGTGQVAETLELDGVNDYIDYGGLSVIDDGLTKPFTISLWVKPLSTLAGQDTILAADAGAASNSGFQLEYFDNNNTFRLKAQEAGTTRGVTIPSSTVSVGTFQHIAITWDPVAQSFTTFAAGQPETSSSVTGAVQNVGTNEFFGGARLNMARESHIALDEVLVYNWILSDAQIETVYDKGVAGVPVTDPVPVSVETSLLPAIMPMIMSRTLPQIYS